MRAAGEGLPGDIDAHHGLLFVVLTAFYPTHAEDFCDFVDNLVLALRHSRLRHQFFRPFRFLLTDFLQLLPHSEMLVVKIPLGIRAVFLDHLAY